MIPQFKPHNVLPHTSTLIVGKRGSGKSFIIKSILQMHNNPYTIIISPTERSNPFYSLILPTAHIIYNYNDQIIHDLISRQRILENKNSDAIIILDDCISHKHPKTTTNTITELLQISPHLHITTIITSQYPFNFTSIINNLFHHIFLTNDDFISSRNLCYKKYAHTLDKTYFINNLKQSTQNFGALVIQKHPNNSHYLSTFHAT